MQEVQAALQAVHQLLALLVALDAQHLGQALGDLLERVGQVAVLVERLDQHHHGGGVLCTEAQVRELRAQMVL